jgi:hypothetical protein
MVITLVFYTIANQPKILVYNFTPSIPTHFCGILFVVGLVETIVLLGHTISLPLEEHVSGITPEFWLRYVNLRHVVLVYNPSNYYDYGNDI